MARVWVRIVKTDAEVQLDEREAMVLVDSGEAVYIGVRGETATASPPENAMKKKPRGRVRK